jgi:hypothetical protein
MNNKILSDNEFECLKIEEHPVKIENSNKDDKLN